MKNINEKAMNFFKTSDLNLAAFLRAKYNLELERVESEDSHRAFFIFKIGEIDIENAVESFYKGEFVSALGLVREIDSLKSMARNLVRV